MRNLTQYEIRLRQCELQVEDCTNALLAILPEKEVRWFEDDMYEVFLAREGERLLMVDRDCTRYPKDRFFPVYKELQFRRLYYAYTAAQAELSFLVRELEELAYDYALQNRGANKSWPRYWWFGEHYLFCFEPDSGCDGVLNGYHLCRIPQSLLLPNDCFLSMK